MKLNKYDRKAISKMLIARCGLGAIKESFKEFPPKGSQYKISIITNLKEESIEKLEELDKINDKYIIGIGKKTVTTIINNATLHINQADEMVKNELRQETDDVNNICEKKIFSCLSICQAGLINAERIFSDSLDNSKNKDMITKDTIQETLDFIESLLEWIEEKYSYLEKFMLKNEMNLTMKRANNYLTLTDQETGLL